MDTREAKRRIALVRRAVREAVAQADLRGALVVGVSGGPDSFALFDALHAQADGLGLRLHVAHLDHGLRASAKDDARFVQALCGERGVPCTMGSADVPKLRREKKLSVEEAARIARYDFLGSVAKKTGAGAIALGHTASDQAETVLLNIVRGAGLTGLRGMDTLSRRTLAGHPVLLFRPLLTLSRADTRAYCDAAGLEPRVDETNDSPDLARGRLRSQLLPALSGMNPSIEQALTRLAANASRDLGYIEAQAAAAWERVAKAKDGVVEIDRKALLALPDALRWHLLRAAVAAARGDLDSLEQNHVEGMARLVRGRAGRSLDLPGGLVFAVGYDTATIRPAGAHTAHPAHGNTGETRLVVPGVTEWGGWRFHASVRPLPRPDEPSETNSAFPDGLTALLSARLADAPLTVRTRKRGELFLPLGMKQPKKLQDF
ncbi:MAG: tRNA lysidine(34) synthetase TilS, partial [SAR202 cluster bacterium]|nr:tRNA lysidine(34) synthetase TilS [SAR202 cluster bacterium]